jgi:hypothetical protein
MNPMAHGRHAMIQAQLLELFGPLGREAGLTALGNLYLGERDDYRIPDGGLQRPGADELYYPTAALVIEIVSDLARADPCRVWPRLSTMRPTS